MMPSCMELVELLLTGKRTLFAQWVFWLGCLDDDGCHGCIYIAVRSVLGVTAHE